MGLSGGGSTATPLLSTPATSDGNGGFNITGTYSCPTDASQVYLLARGGNPGLAPGTNNAAITLMAALGPCGNLSSSTFINVDEVTTVALANSLAPFTYTTSAIGSTPSDAILLNAAFAMANRFASTTTGTSPGTNVPSGDTVPVSKVNTLANILAACINSAGGTAGDSSACGTLFSLATMAGTSSPTDTFTAAVRIADTPALNTAALFNTSSASAPFQPALTSAPSDFSLSLGVPAGLQPSVVTAAFGSTLVGSAAPGQTITLSNTSASAIALSSIAVTGAYSANFVQTNNCPVSLAASASCAVQLTFTPSGTGRHAAALAISNSSALSPLLVGLSGVGTNATTAPTLTSASPASIIAGAGTTVVTLTGAGFTPTTMVYLNNTSQTTTYLSPQSVSFVLSSYYDYSPVTLSLYARNAAGSSSSISVAVVNPVPVLTAISPSSVIAGSPSFTLTLTGSNFGSSPTVLINGVTHSTYSSTANTLSVSVAATEIASLGNLAITIVSPSPGGGSSAPQQLQVISAGNRVRTLGYSTNDLVTDPVRTMVYASVNSYSSLSPNSLVSVDPTQGTVVTTATLNGTPDRIAISDDGAYLYVSLPSTAEIARFKLPSLTPDLRWTIPAAAQDLKVAPGLPHTLAVSDIDASQASSTVRVYDDAVARPNHPAVSYAGNSFDTLAWGATASVLYATNSRGSGGPEYVLTVDGNGPTLASTYNSALGNFLKRLVFDKATNRLYDGYGNIVDPGTGGRNGQFTLRNTLSYEQNDVAVDAPGNRAFVLNGNYISSTYTSQTQDLQAFDLGSFSYINALAIPGLSGSHLVRWGASGLAIGGGSQIFLIDGTFVSSAGTGTPIGGYAAASPTITSLTPGTVYAGDGPTTVTVTGKDFTTAAVATWNSQSVALTVQSPTQATITFSAAQLATATTSAITLTNGPGTENSNAVPFTVLPNLGANTQIVALNLSGQDMAYDPTRGLLYVAVTDPTAVNGNSIVTVDPALAAITATQFTGFQPSTLGLSNDGKYLYAGFQTLAAVRRYALQDFSLNLTIPLTLGPNNQNFAGDIKVAPGQNQTIAVSFGTNLLEPRDSGGMAIYDNVTPRTQTSTYSSGPDTYKLAWGSDATHLYAHSDPEFQGQSLSIFAVSSAGLSRTVALSGYTNLALRPHYDAGTNLVYSDGGHIADPLTGAEAGTLSSSGFLATDSALNRAFVLHTTGSGYALDTFDLRHQTLLKSVALPGISGYPTQLLRWGTQGLAILTDSPGMLYLLQGSDISGLPTPPANSITLNPSAVAVSSLGDVTIGVTGSNFGASSVVELAGTAQPTTVLSSTQLTFQLPASQTAFAHYLNVAVTNLANNAGTSPDAVLEVDNPAPAISSTGTGIVKLGATDTALVLTGTGFLSASVVNFNGTPLATTYLTATSLSYVVPSADLTTAGLFNLTVVNPAPGGGTSAAAVLEVDNPSPTVTSVSPSTISTGSGSSTVSVIGTNFTKATVITVNGTTVPATYYTSAQMQVVVPASYFASPGSLSFRASNPAPGGGSSAAVSLAVNSVTPSALTLSPSSVAVGASSAPITITGLNFIPSSVVQIFGQSRTTTYVSPTQLTFLLKPTDVATAGMLYVQVVNPVLGGSSSNYLLLTATAGATGTAVISSISPAQVTVNSPATTLSIYASNLSAASFAQWNGVALAGTSYPNYGYIYATVPASLLTSVGTASVTINSPGAAAPVSSSFTVSVVAAAAPTLTSISPSNGPIGVAVTVTLTGTNFTSTSVVSVNGDVLPTTLVSSTQLTVAVPGSELPLGNNLFSITTPAPGGGASATAAYTTYVAQSSNSMIYNPVNGLFYLSVPASAGTPYGNSVVSVDPVSGALGQPIFVGSEPNRLALTADGRYLWVGLNGSNSVRKVDLLAGTAGLQFVLPTISNSSGLSTPLALAAIPGQTDSVAVSLYNQSSPAYLGIFDSGVLRGPLSPGNSLLFGPLVLQIDGTRNEIYSAQGQYYEVWNYNSAGLSVKASTTTASYLSNSSDQRIQVSNGKTYTDSGPVLNAETGALVGNLATSSTAFSTAVDGTLSRAYVLGAPTMYASYPTQISLFNTTDLSSASTSTIPVSLATSNYTTTPYVSTLTRWGANGLAFRSSVAFFALRSNLVQDLSSTSADLSLTLAAAGASTTGSSTTYTAMISNAGPAAASEVRFLAAAPATGVVTSITTPMGLCRSQSILACDLGSLGSGASTAVTIVVNQLTAGTATLTAQSNASQSDLNLTNNLATSTLQIGGATFNVAPTLQSLTPSSVLTGSTDTVITATGVGFTATSVLQLDGAGLSTSYLSPTQLTAVVPAASLTSLGWHGLTVSTPAPGGG
ncbi:MAG: beta strand repeat-containing protein, partial [Janthinobacterium lividum]